MEFHRVSLLARWSFCIAVIALPPYMPIKALPQTRTFSSPERPLLLQAGQGELRVRRPVSVSSHIGVAVKAFIIKVDRVNGGSQNLMFITETFPPRAVIPRHRHLRQDEIVFIEHGTVLAHVGTLHGLVGDGGTIYIPNNTWVTIRNVGPTNINLLAFFSGSDFDEYMRCASVLPRAKSTPLSPEARKACATKGHAEYRGL